MGRSNELIAEQGRKRASLLAPGADGKPRFTEDQVKEIESVMTAYGIADYDAGVVLYRDKNPPPTPDPIPLPDARMGATWEFPSIEGMNFTDFAKDPVKASRNAAYGVIAEFGKRRRVA